MTKKAKTVRTIISIILLVLSAFQVFVNVYTGIDIYLHRADEFSALGILIPIYLAIFTSPIFIANLIYQIVMICKKKVYKLELISSIIYFTTFFAPTVLITIIKIIVA